MTNVSGSSRYASPTRGAPPVQHAAAVQPTDTSKSPSKVKFASSAAHMPDHPSAAPEEPTTKLTRNTSLASLSSLEKNEKSDRKRSKLSTLIQLQNKESQEVEKSTFAAKKI